MMRFGFADGDAPVVAKGVDAPDDFAAHPPSITTAEVPAAPLRKERRDIRDMGYSVFARDRGLGASGQFVNPQFAWQGMNPVAWERVGRSLDGVGLNGRGNI